MTFLHLFHHASITVIVGSLLPLDYAGDMQWPVLVNRSVLPSRPSPWRGVDRIHPPTLHHVAPHSLVHVAVYLHYFLTCIGIQPFWSGYLTSLQVTN